MLLVPSLLKTRSLSLRAVTKLLTISNLSPNFIQFCDKEPFLWLYSEQFYMWYTRFGNQQRE